MSRPFNQCLQCQCLILKLNANIQMWRNFLQLLKDVSNYLGIMIGKNEIGSNKENSFNTKNYPFLIIIIITHII
jgi:hypothetical protein